MDRRSQPAGKEHDRINRHQQRDERNAQAAAGGRRLCPLASVVGGLGRGTWSGRMQQKASNQLAPDIRASPAADAAGVWQAATAGLNWRPRPPARGPARRTARPAYGRPSAWQAQRLASGVLGCHCNAAGRARAPARQAAVIALRKQAPLPESPVTRKPRYPKAPSPDSPVTGKPPHAARADPGHLRSQHRAARCAREHQRARAAALHELADRRRRPRFVPQRLDRRVHALHGRRAAADHRDRGRRDPRTRADPGRRGRSQRERDLGRLRTLCRARRALGGDRLADLLQAQPGQRVRLFQANRRPLADRRDAVQHSAVCAADRRRHRGPAGGRMPPDRGDQGLLRRHGAHAPDDPAGAAAAPRFLLSHRLGRGPAADAALRLRRRHQCGGRHRAAADPAAV